MAVTGKREPMINGTRSCGGYSKEGLIKRYEAARPEAPQIAASVFNNYRVPGLGTLWTIAEELADNTRKRLHSGGELPATRRRRQSDLHSETSQHSYSGSDADSPQASNKRPRTSRARRVQRKALQDSSEDEGGGNLNGDEGGGGRPAGTAAAGGAAAAAAAPAAAAAAVATTGAGARRCKRSAQWSAA